MSTIYVTHCSREKDPALQRSGGEGTPEQLYTAEGLQRFIAFCKSKEYHWAIFSDHYGVVFPEEKINWYSKPPDTVSEEQFAVLLDSFINRLWEYDRIYFFHRPEEAHPLFQRIVTMGRERGMNILELTEEIINDGIHKIT